MGMRQPAFWAATLLPQFHSLILALVVSCIDGDTHHNNHNNKNDNSKQNSINKLERESHQDVGPVIGVWREALLLGQLQRQIRPERLVIDSYFIRLITIMKILINSV